MLAIVNSVVHEPVTIVCVLCIVCFLFAVVGFWFIVCVGVMYLWLIVISLWFYCSGLLYMGYFGFFAIVAVCWCCVVFICLVLCIFFLLAVAWVV